MNVRVEPWPAYLAPIESQLSAKYQFIREIASGKTGRTYLIQDHSTEGMYCLKTISPSVEEMSDRETVRENLSKEVDILKPLTHKCLPRVYEHDIKSDLPYYICTFHAGMTWKTFKKEARTLTSEESIYLISALIDTVEYLHSQGRTHCDLHESNIMISPRIFADGILIIDFGSGHRLTDSSSETHDRGHPGIKNLNGLARDRRKVNRREAAKDFEASDIKGLGAALHSMSNTFFSDGPYDQRLAYTEFCKLLYEGAVAKWEDVKEHFRYVMDPNVLTSDNEQLFIMKDGSRVNIIIPGGYHVPVGEAILSIVNTDVFQKLRGIRQLSFCEWEFPGGMHCRFEHSLGVFTAVEKAIKHLTLDRNFRLNYTSLNLRGALLAGLLHDIGHYPFAHVIEHYVAGRYPQDMNMKRATHHSEFTMKIIEGDRELSQAIHRNWGERTHEEAIRVIKPGLGALSQIIDGPIDCDKIDYLKRDSLHCGVSYGIGFHPAEVIESYCCAPECDSILVSRDRVHEIEGFMVLQDQMLAAVYWHETVRAIFAMFHRILDITVGGNVEKLVEIVAGLRLCSSESEGLRKVFYPLLESYKERGRDKKDSKTGVGRKVTSVEMESLVRFFYEPNYKHIYKSVAKYSVTDVVNPRIRAMQTIYEAIVNPASAVLATGIPIKWEAVKWLRDCYRYAIERDGVKLGAFDVLVDVAFGKGSNRVVQVMEQLDGTVIDITKVSHLAESIFVSPAAFSAPVRVYVSPDIYEQCRQHLSSIRLAAEDRFFEKKAFQEFEGD